jgi:hypothetical protein
MLALLVASIAHTIPVPGVVPLEEIEGLVPFPQNLVPVNAVGVPEMGEADAAS